MKKHFQQIFSAQKEREKEFFAHANQKAHCNTI